MAKKENPGNYQAHINLWVVVEQMIWEIMSWHMKNKIVRGNSQHRYIKGKMWLVDLIVFIFERREKQWMAFPLPLTTQCLSIASLQFSQWDKDYMWITGGWNPAGLLDSKVVISGLKSSWLLSTGDFPKGLYLKLTLMFWSSYLKTQARQD